MAVTWHFAHPTKKGATLWHKRNLLRIMGTDGAKGRIALVNAPVSQQGTPMADKALSQFAFGGIFVLANKLQTLGDALDDQVTVKQWNLIDLLAESPTPLSVSELASWIGSSRQNTRKMAGILAEEGFLNLEESAHDKRTLNVSLTTKGKLYHTKRARMNAAFLDLLFKEFSDQELEALCLSIKKLADSTDALEERATE